MADIKPFPLTVEKSIVIPRTPMQELFKKGDTFPHFSALSARPTFLGSVDVVADCFDLYLPPQIENHPFMPPFSGGKAHHFLVVES